MFKSHTIKMTRLDATRFLVCCKTWSHRLEAPSQPEDNVAQLRLQPQYSLNTTKKRFHLVFLPVTQTEDTICSRKTCKWTNHFYKQPERGPDTIKCDGSCVLTLYMHYICKEHESVLLIWSSVKQHTPQSGIFHNLQHCYCCLCCSMSRACCLWVFVRFADDDRLSSEACSCRYLWTSWPLEASAIRGRIKA